MLPCPKTGALYPRKRARLPDFLHALAQKVGQKWRNPDDSLSQILAPFINIYQASSRQVAMVKFEFHTLFPLYVRDLRPVIYR